MTDNNEREEPEHLWPNHVVDDEYVVVPMNNAAREGEPPR